MPSRPTSWLPPRPPNRAFSGALRLLRWLAEPVSSVTGLPSAVDDYLRNTSWVDTALVTARRGAGEADPSRRTSSRHRSRLRTTAVGDRRFAAVLPTPRIRPLRPSRTCCPTL